MKQIPKITITIKKNNLRLELTIYGPVETDIRIEMYGALLSDLVDKKNVHALPLTTSIINFP